MTRAIILALILLATPAQAGFKMFGPNGQMNSTETEAERESRTKREEEYRNYIDYVRATTAIHAAPRKQSQPAYTKEELMQGTPCPRPVDDDPAPGGHWRHVWRERTGFNTPAERTRYEREIRRLDRELKKERAKPNPAGAHPEEIRKQFKATF